jgi:AcrR family transcriptional regulator
MPRTAEQNEQLRAESRAKLLATALRLFAEQGYEQTTVKLIAQEAGIAQGLLYNYFASKDALLRALFTQGMQDVRATFTEAEAAAPQDQAARLISSSFAAVRQNRQFWLLAGALRRQPAVQASLGTSMSEWTAQILGTLEGYFRAAGAADPAIEAAILFAIIDGVTTHYILDPHNYPLEAVEAALLAKYSQQE